MADASLFTTQSIDAISRKIRAQLQVGAVTFALGANGERTVFPLSSVRTIQLQRQVGTATFATSFLPTTALSIFPGSVGTIPFGSYASPDYENSAEGIPAGGARAGTPAPQATNPRKGTLFLP